MFWCLVPSLNNHLQTYVFFRTSWDVDFMQTRNPPPSVMANKFSVLWLIIEHQVKFYEIFQTVWNNFLMLFLSVAFMLFDHLGWLWCWCGEALKHLLFGLCMVYKFVPFCVRFEYMYPMHFLLCHIRAWVAKSFCSVVALASFSNLGLRDRIIYTLKVEL